MMHFNRRLFFLRYLPLTIAGLLAPLLKSRSSSAETTTYNDLPAPTTLSWYGKVPGIDQSPDIKKSRRYRVHVRVEGSDTWKFVTAYETGSKARQIQDINPLLANQASDLGYYTHLRDWTHTYVNFEVPTGIRVEVKISRVDGQSITSAAVHPRRASAPHRLEGKDVIVTVTKPCLIFRKGNASLEAHPRQDLMDELSVSRIKQVLAEKATA
ncbi:MAG: hypothetical protein VKJ24_16645 [Synechococcales bacterium]|nr:hypothetical protein [Synechococcales bacterium]